MIHGKAFAEEILYFGLLATIGDYTTTVVIVYKKRRFAVLQQNENINNFCIFYDGGQDGRRRFESNVSQLCFKIQKQIKYLYSYEMEDVEFIYVEINNNNYMFFQRWRPMQLTADNRFLL